MQKKLAASFLAVACLYATIGVVVPRLQPDPFWRAALTIRCDLVVGLGAALVVSHLLTRRLRALAAAQEIRRGDPTRTVDTRGQDETGELAQLTETQRDAARDVRVDRALLDLMLDPLLHLVRNAIDHGLESAEERRAAGKPPHGTLRLTVVRGGDSMRIEVEDDGRGLDPDALRRAAAERGFLSVSEAARLGDAEAFMLAALPGLSTAPGRSDVSGRGVGLDVVKGSLEEIGGRLAIDRGAGGGTRITLFLPLTLALIQALLDDGSIVPVLENADGGLVRAGR